MTDFNVQPGDIYSLGGKHRLACGDATNKEDVKRLFNGRKPTLVVTSPPYAKQRDYDRPIACWDLMMLGALDGHEFADDVQMLVNLGVIHANNEWQPYWHQWIAEMRSKRWRHYSTYIWDKNVVAPGCFHGRLPPSFEFIHHVNKMTVNANKWAPCRINAKSRQGEKGGSNILKKDGSPDRRSRKLVHQTKVPRNVLQVAAVRQNESTGHPAQMPVALAIQLIKTWKRDYCITYDCFAGSGTTLHAAEQEGASGLGMEISPAYIAIALTRWAKAYPEQPITKVAVAP